MPMQRNLYPEDWEEIALNAKIAANWTCQLCGAQREGKQRNRHGELVDVQIGVMHRDHNPWDRNARLVVACRICHITYDAKDARRKRVMMQIARGQLVLPGLRDLYQQPRLRKQRTTSQRPHKARAKRQQRRVKKEAKKA